MSTGSKTDCDKFDKQKTLLKTMIVVKKWVELPKVARPVEITNPAFIDLREANP